MNTRTEYHDELILDYYPHYGVWWCDAINTADGEVLATYGPYVSETEAVRAQAIPTFPSGYANSIFIHQDSLWAVKGGNDAISIT